MYMWKSALVLTVVLLLSFYFTGIELEGHAREVFREIPNIVLDGTRVGLT